MISVWFRNCVSSLLLCAAIMQGQSNPPTPASQEKSKANYPADCNTTSVMSEDILNFHKVDADLYRGARPTRRDVVYLKLASLGIRTVLNLEGGREAAKESAEIARVNEDLMRQGKPTIQFICFPIKSFFQTVLASISDQRMRVLFQEIQNAQKPLFIHCRHGKDRTGAIVVLYRLKRREGGTFDDALREARHYRFSSWNFGLKRTIGRYQDPRKFSLLPSPVAGSGTPDGVCLGR
jgi:protein tyrosine phosphatase (PTP) superfamily phosphohydrolase (DUF442 family)